MSRVPARAEQDPRDAARRWDAVLAAAGRNLRALAESPAARLARAGTDGTRVFTGRTAALAAEAGLTIAALWTDYLAATECVAEATRPRAWGAGRRIAPGDLVDTPVLRRAATSASSAPEDAGLLGGSADPPKATLAETVAGMERAFDHVQGILTAIGEAVAEGAPSVRALAREGATLGPWLDPATATLLAGLDRHAGDPVGLASALGALKAGIVAARARKAAAVPAAPAPPAWAARLAAAEAAAETMGRAGDDLRAWLDHIRTALDSGAVPGALVGLARWEAAAAARAAGRPGAPDAADLAGYFGALRARARAGGAALDRATAPERDRARTAIAAGQAGGAEARAALDAYATAIRARAAARA